MGRGSSGLNSGGGGKALSHNDAEAKTLAKEEKRITPLKNEQLIVVDENGNIVMHKKGTKDHVTYTVGEARQAFDNAIVTHNHPDNDVGWGGTLSEADLSAFGYGAKEMRATAAEGAYSLYPTKGAHTGDWLRMQGDLHRASQGWDNEGYLSRMKRAESHKSVQTIDKQLKPLEAKAVDLMNKSKANPSDSALQKQFMDAYNAYDKVAKSRSQTLKRVMRQEYTGNYDTWYKKNASKYGFTYVSPVK